MTDKLLELHQLAIVAGAKHKKQRYLFKQLLQHTGRPFLGLVGARGSGKTVLLKQLAQQRSDAFYISLDTAGPIDLFALAKDLNRFQGIRLLLLDEAHFLKNINAQLKKLYDFLDLEVIFTSSVALLMYESAYDLARRVQLLELPLLSFREYIYFTEDILLEVLTLQQIADSSVPMPYLRYEHRFKEYLQGRLLPFALETYEYLPLLRNILEKVVQRDIPRVAEISISELDLLKKLISFISKSKVDGINPTSIGKNLAISKYKASQYLNLLERAFVIKQIKPAGTNVLKEPKVLLRPAYRLLELSYEEAIGGLREDFAVEMLTAIPKHVGELFYLKNERGKKCPDFLLKMQKRNFVIEIGGKGKGTLQFKGFSEQFTKLVFGQGLDSSTSKFNLSLLGFLY